MPEQKDWTWDPQKEDPELAKHGLIAAVAAGRSTAVQAFVEALSERIGAKCDWSYTGGRAHIDVPEDKLDEAQTAIQDEAWLKPFLMPYSSETWANGTYFEILYLSQKA